MAQLVLHYRLEIQGRPNDYGRTVLELSDQGTGFSYDKALDVVYQYGYYHQVEFIFDGDTSDVEDIYLIAHGKEVRISHSRTDSGFVITPVGAESEAQFFAAVFGVTRLELSVINRSGTKRHFFTDHVAVAVPNRNSTDSHVASLKKMLDFIRVEDMSLLRRDAMATSGMGQRFQRAAQGELDEQVQCLKRIVQLLKSNLPLFFHSTKTVTVTDFRIDSFDKLRSINFQNLAYIATHPEYLRESFGAHGIYVDRHQMIPDKTLVSSNRLSRDNWENQTILSFIFTLMRQVNAMRAVSAPQEKRIQLKSSLPSSFKLNVDIIHEYMQEVFADAADELGEISKQLASLFTQYQDILQCGHSFLKRMPKPSPFFLEILHYRKIYECMVDWFGDGEIEEARPHPRRQVHFASADTIYEYFCLLQICRLLREEFGFEQDYERNERYDYEVESPHATQNQNTFYFRKDDCEVTVYYEPVIYANDNSRRNGIGLRRVFKDGYDDNYYTPDFLLKKREGDKETYAVLDSKWSRMEELAKAVSDKGHCKGNIFVNTLFKYVNAVLDENTNQHVPFFWLLTGVDNYYSPNPLPFRLNDTDWCKSRPQVWNAMGMVELTPKSGTGQFGDLLQSFINDF